MGSTRIAHPFLFSFLNGIFSQNAKGYNSDRLIDHELLLVRLKLPPSLFTVCVHTGCVYCSLALLASVCVFGESHLCACFILFLSAWLCVSWPSTRILWILNSFFFLWVCWGIHIHVRMILHYVLTWDFNMNKNHG